MIAKEEDYIEEGSYCDILRDLLNIHESLSSLFKDYLKQMNDKLLLLPENMDKDTERDILIDMRDKAYDIKIPAHQIRDLIEFKINEYYDCDSKYPEIRTKIEKLRERDEDIRASISDFIGQIVDYADSKGLDVPYPY
jgi:hypothetical protein